ncbi:CBASS cGAMP synthase [Cryomorphaceae bacterium 1068]|nr:CBASS cGAMP synthase [Cryomorphaceae bacterium 1068]
MSNCHNLFQTFNGNLNIKPAKKTNLMTSRDTLRDRIRTHFKEKHNKYTPFFKGQGSYSLGTMIRTKDDTCDLDNGVYFFPKPGETGTTLQKWVWEAVENATSVKPQHRQRCIRVIYANDYHIDLPVYFKLSKTDDNEKPHLAVKNSEWALSDPKEFSLWFNEIKDANGQLIRIVRYLKAWCDNRSNKMPNGLTMTVLAARLIEYDDRDDVCLRNTIKKIESNLRANWSCVMPTTPNDDLLANFSGSREYFLDSIRSLIEDADKAIESEENQLRASKLWRKYLGSYFPEGEDRNVDKQESILVATAASILAGKAKLNNSGQIQENSGVSHMPHKNYGGE